MLEHCPTPERLAAAVYGSPSEDDAELAVHVSDCPACQARLEELAGGPAWLEARLRILARAKRPDQQNQATPHAAQPSPLLEQAMEKLRRRAEPSANSTDPLLATGTRLRYFGDYEILDELGRGGMGVVYKARQVSLNRLVGLKLILTGQLASASDVRRFRNEAEAAARLDHPNILPIYEIGEHEGRHYFSMKLVEGEPLSSRMADLRSKKSFCEIARLVAQMAHAVHYAHQHGILHRDLKPSNILLAPDDQPHLTDFGLAKILESDSSLTQSVAVMGTPNYMAPEVAAGKAREVTTVVDVFSLGAILYELLTGRPPFQAETTAATLHQVIHTDPVSPQAVDPRVPRDLATICLKCLEKVPARRYSSAAAVAEELERFLESKPILARPVNVPERVWRWAVRNPAVATLVAVVHVVLALGLAGILWEWHRAEHIAEAEREARVIAQRNRENAKMAALKSSQVASFLQTTLQSAQPSLALGRDTTILREILDRAADRVSNDLTDQPDVELALLDTLAKVYRALDEDEKAQEIDETALSLAQTVFGTNHLTVAAALHGLALDIYSHGQRNEAEAMMRQALAMRRGLLGNIHSDVASSLYYLSRMVRHSNPIGFPNIYTLTTDPDRLPESEGLAREALAIRRKIFGDEHPDIAASLADLADVLDTEADNAPEFRSEKLAEAENLIREALAMQQRLLGNEHPDVAKSLYRLALILSHRNKLAESEEVFHTQLDLQRKLWGNEHPSTWGSCRTRVLLLVLGHHNLSAAASLFREQVKLMRTNRSDFAGATIFAVQNILLDNHKPDRAEKFLNTLLSPGFLNQPQVMEIALGFRADLYSRRGRWPEAIADYRRLIELKPADYRSYGKLAALLVQTGDREACRKLTHTILEHFGETQDPEVACEIGLACQLLPDSEIEWPPISFVSSKLQSPDGFAGDLSRFQLCKALSDYRAARFAEAATWAQESLVESTNKAELALADCAVLAMAQKRLHQDIMASTTLSKCVKLESELPQLNRGGIGRDWQDWIMAHALLGEARTVARATDN